MRTRVLAGPSARLSRAVNNAASYRPVYFRTGDGLRLFARDYAPANATLTPLLCLPGLTRNSKDFETIAPWLSQSRRIIALDFRGRGLSQHAPDPMSYRPDVELADAISLLNALGIERVAVVGTSRGGIVGMLMAAFFRDRLAGLFLNDVGPELERAGLIRIRSYLGVQAGFRSWESAIDHLKANNPGFELPAHEGWQMFARRLFRSAGGLPKIDYDPALASTFPSVEEIQSGQVATLWELFAKAEGLPLAVVRGEHSDLLSAATVEAMKQRNASLDATTVAKRGHAPFLDEEPAREAISRWLERVDA